MLTIRRTSLVTKDVISPVALQFRRAVCSAAVVFIGLTLLHGEEPARVLDLTSRAKNVTAPGPVTIGQVLDGSAGVRPSFDLPLEVHFLQCTRLKNSPA